MPVVLATALLVGTTWLRGGLQRIPRRGLGTTLSAATHEQGAPRLLLTSSGLSTSDLERSFHRMLDKACAQGNEERSIALLVTAAMAPSSDNSRRSPGELRRRRWADARKKGRELEAKLGVPVQCLDCARIDAINDVEQALERAACIWVSGGNTFFLWHWMKTSGVADLIKQRVMSDGVLYVGQSAGAIVAGRSISTALWKGWDDPTVVPDVDWGIDHVCDAMTLANVSFFPHYSEEWEELVQANKDALGHECVRLSDDGTKAYITGDQQ